MSTGFGLFIIAEVLLTFAAALGIVYEERVIVFERQVARVFRAIAKKIARRISAARHRRVNARVAYRPVPVKRASRGSRAA